MINSIINIDLHIHSDESAYKDGEKIVGNSNKKNIEILFKKLDSHEVKLFSITDHNRFNLELYNYIDEKLSDINNPYNLALLAGVEFDVVLDTGKKSAHIVTIFDCKNKSDYVKIYNAIEANKLTNKDQTYSKTEYEEILRTIGLDTLLIVHQKKSLDNSNGKHASLSDSSSDPYKVIQIGYVDALEYQKPNVQGILKNNLRNIDSTISLITGTDCHDWKEYPKHSKGKNDFSGPFTTIKALPSFKGLHISLMSPLTRINRKSNNNTNYIDKFSINNKIVNLDPGLNAIIGDNGSGKSTLLSFIADNINKSYQKEIIENNKMTLNTHLGADRIKHFSQTEVVTKYNEKKLFGTEGGYYKSIDNTVFENEYKKYANDLKNTIETNISKYHSTEVLKDLNFEFSGEHNKDNFYVSIPEYADKWENAHEERKNQLKIVIQSIVNELSNEYYVENNIMVDLELTLKEIIDIYYTVLDKYVKEKIIIETKNIITSSINNYNRLKAPKVSDKETTTNSYNTEKETFIFGIVDAIKKNSVETSFPKLPKLVNGTSENVKHGFKFNREALYNKKDLSKEFLTSMFNTDFRSITFLENIKQKSVFIKAVAGATEGNLDNKWKDLLEKFLVKYSKTNEYILEVNFSEEIGNTMGELSLTYYKYHFQESKEVDVFLIDQPEDNISNTKIVEDLISYFNSIRHEKQVIFVTHNPLLVVNLDVDNVIVLDKTNNNISLISGCIENEEKEIIKNISSKMEGGKEMIEKRLKIYA